MSVSPDGKYVAVVRDYQVGPGSSTDESVSSFSARIPSFATPSSSTGFWGASDDLLLIATGGEDMDSSTAAAEHVLFLGTRTDTATSVNPAVPGYARSRSIFHASQRRINGLVFSQTSRTLFVNYAGSIRPVKYYGSTNGWGINPESATSSTFAFGTQMIAQLDFRTAGGAAIDFTNSSSWASNALQGVGSGISAIGPTSPSFSNTDSSDQQFWSTFKSPDGRFLYYVSDQTGNGRTFLVGLNITGADIGPHQPFAPFSPHATTVGLSQIEVNSFNYSNRFASVPGGTVLPATGRHGGGILCVIASDASAGATSTTDMEVYAFDANNGGDFFNLSATVTDGTSNAINHPYLSTDGNILVFQRSKTTVASRDTRVALTGTSDLIGVGNVHAVLFSWATPTAFVVSENKSHGASVALVGEGTVTGPQAVIFSAADAGGNTTWDERTLRAALIADRPPSDQLDSTQSHYAVLGGARRLNDNSDTSD